MTQFKSHAGQHYGEIRDAQQQDYTQANLCDAAMFGTFDRCVFKHTDMSMLDMSRCKFVRCVFSFCDMNDADARGSVFEDCEFLGCYMREAKFCDTHWDNCNLKACLASHTDFEDAVFEKGSLSGNFMNSLWKGATLKDVDHKKILLLGALGFPGEA